ncbi:MAG: cysteine desulfurase [Candidatus Marinimicrobia bacterium]|nr:cysteine desulfurase [Candidatus Neomarinimicrobiota bacterium]MCF7829186.1 cysteine desulfurase [Candidatus Neomarinimicrobiota bacterium]MCF7881161.1 cysteine desulfurase [Candidatus Neomarinimicrobiota bacterium]
MRNRNENTIYADHSATTPVDSQVVDEMRRIMTNVWGNASSVHQIGRSAKVELEQARETIAGALNASRNEILFTSGATESDNFALRGLAQAFRNKGKHIITSKAEHHAVLHTCEALDKNGFSVTYLDVDKHVMVNPGDVEAVLTDETILISIMHANNEIGTINPIDEIGKIAQEHDIPFHTDAVQTFGKLPLDVSELPVDALSVSGHKIYGPKGIGFLYVNKNLDIIPQLTGGAQERNLRAGTENLPAIVGLAKAVELALESQNSETDRLRNLQKSLEIGLTEQIPGATVHGHPEKRIAGLTHIGFDGVDGESLVMNLDMRGIAVSSGSACSSGTVNPSHVLLAMGYEKDRAKSAIRISLGRSNTEEDIPVLIDAIREEVERIRTAGEQRNQKKEEIVHA